MGSPSYIVLLLMIALSSLSFLPMATPTALANSAIAAICQGTPYPDICIRTTGKHAKGSNVDAIAVFNMQATALKRRAEAAQRRAKEATKSAPIASQKALNLCASMYIDTMDQIGSAERAMGFKDKKTVRAMLEIAVRELESCNQQFKEARISNPLANFNASLSKMANNCIALAEMA